MEAIVVPEPPWLQAKVDQKIAHLQASIPTEMLLLTHIVVTPLTEPPPGSNQFLKRAWDKMCDNCNTYDKHIVCGRVEQDWAIELPNGRTHYGMYVIVWGSCSDCIAGPE